MENQSSIKSNYSKAIRVTAFLTALVFSSSSAIWAQVPFTPSQVTQSSANVVASIKEVIIPKELGSVQAAFQAPQDRPFVFIVQDAHAIPDAQRSIQGLIDYFQKEYGVGLVALEGAISKLDTQFFRSFPDKELLKKVFQEYQSQGELAGGTASAIFNESKSVYHGIEDWNLYEEGISLYLKALEQEPQILTKLQAQKKDIQAKKEKTYSKTLLDIDRSLERFYENGSSLPEVLKKLSEVKAPSQDSELALILSEIAKEGNQDNAIEMEVKQMARAMSSFLEARITEPGVKEKQSEFNSKFQQFNTSRFAPQAFALYLRDLAQEFGLSTKGSEALARSMNTQKRIQEIKGTKLFDDFEDYAREVKASLFRNNEEKTIDRKSQRLHLLERFASLELSHEDWAGLISSNGNRTKEELEILNLTDSHFKFYEVAKKRDEVFFERVQGLMKKEGAKASLVVAGGFHAEGLTAKLKENNISYLLIAPHMDRVPEETNYQAHMRGDVSWKDYFQAENGRVSLYKAFIRGTRDKLLREANSQNTFNTSNLLKNWRDQIIRDLAEKGEIARAHEYTRFIDEITQKGVESEKQNQWMSKIERFIQGLEHLEAGKQLTKENILKLLQPATTADPSTYGGSDPTAFLSAALIGRAETRAKDLTATIDEYLRNQPIEFYKKPLDIIDPKFSRDNDFEVIPEVLDYIRGAYQKQQPVFIKQFNTKAIFNLTSAEYMQRQILPTAAGQPEAFIIDLETIFGPNKEQLKEKGRIITVREIMEQLRKNPISVKSPLLIQLEIYFLVTDAIAGNERNPETGRRTLRSDLSDKDIDRAISLLEGVNKELNKQAYQGQVFVSGFSRGLLDRSEGYINDLKSARSEVRHQQAVNVMTNYRNGIGLREVLDYAALREVLKQEQARKKEVNEEIGKYKRDLQNPADQAALFQWAKTNIARLDSEDSSRILGIFEFYRDKGGYDFIRDFFEFVKENKDEGISKEEFLSDISTQEFYAVSLNKRIEGHLKQMRKKMDQDPKDIELIKAWTKDVFNVIKPLLTQPDATGETFAAFGKAWRNLTGFVEMTRGRSDTALDEWLVSFYNEHHLAGPAIQRVDPENFVEQDLAAYQEGFLKGFEFYPGHNTVIALRKLARIARERGNVPEADKRSRHAERYARLVFHATQMAGGVEKGDEWALGTIIQALLFRPHTAEGFLPAGMVVVEVDEKGNEKITISEDAFKSGSWLKALEEKIDDSQDVREIKRVLRRIDQYMRITGKMDTYAQSDIEAFTKENPEDQTTKDVLVVMRAIQKVKDEEKPRLIHTRVRQGSVLDLLFSFEDSVSNMVHALLLAGNFRVNGRLPDYQINRSDLMFFDQHILSKKPTDVLKDIQKDISVILDSIEKEKTEAKKDMTKKLSYWEAKRKAYQAMQKTVNAFAAKLSADPETPESIYGLNEESFNTMIDIILRFRMETQLHEGLHSFAHGLNDDSSQGIVEATQARITKDSTTTLAAAYLLAIADCREHAYLKQLMFNMWKSQQVGDLMRAYAQVVEEAAEPEVLDSILNELGRISRLQMFVFDAVVRANFDMEKFYEPKRDAEGRLIYSPNIQDVEAHTLNILLEFDESGNIVDVKLRDAFYQGKGDEQREYQFGNLEIQFNGKPISRQNPVTQRDFLRMMGDARYWESDILDPAEMGRQILAHEWLSSQLTADERSILSGKEGGVYQEDEQRFVLHNLTARLLTVAELKDHLKIPEEVSDVVRKARNMVQKNGWIADQVTSGKKNVQDFNDFELLNLTEMNRAIMDAFFDGAVEPRSEGVPAGEAEVAGGTARIFLRSDWYAGERRQQASMDINTPLLRGLRVNLPSERTLSRAGIDPNMGALANFFNSQKAPASVRSETRFQEWKLESLRHEIYATLLNLDSGVDFYYNYYDANQYLQKFSKRENSPELAEEIAQFLEGIISRLKDVQQEPYRGDPVNERRTTSEVSRALTDSTSYVQKLRSEMRIKSQEELDQQIVLAMDAINRGEEPANARKYIKIAPTGILLASESHKEQRYRHGSVLVTYVVDENGSLKDETWGSPAVTGQAVILSNGSVKYHGSHPLAGQEVKGRYNPDGTFIIDQSNGPDVLQNEYLSNVEFVTNPANYGITPTATWQYGSKTVPNYVIQIDPDAEGDFVVTTKSGTRINITGGDYVVINTKKGKADGMQGVQAAQFKATYVDYADYMLSLKTAGARSEVRVTVKPSDPNFIDALKDAETKGLSLIITTATGERIRVKFQARGLAEISHNKIATHAYGVYSVMEGRHDRRWITFHWKENETYESADYKKLSAVTIGDISVPDYNEKIATLQQRGQLGSERFSNYLTRLNDSQRAALQQLLERMRIKNEEANDPMGALNELNLLMSKAPGIFDGAQTNEFNVEIFQYLVPYFKAADIDLPGMRGWLITELSPSVPELDLNLRRAIVGGFVDGLEEVLGRSEARNIETEAMKQRIYKLTEQWREKSVVASWDEALKESSRVETDLERARNQLSAAEEYERWAKGPMGSPAERDDAESRLRSSRGLINTLERRKEMLGLISGLHQEIEELEGQIREAEKGLPSQEQAQLRKLHALRIEVAKAQGRLRWEQSPEGWGDSDERYFAESELESAKWNLAFAEREARSEVRDLAEEVAVELHAKWRADFVAANGADAPRWKAAKDDVWAAQKTQEFNLTPGKEAGNVRMTADGKVEIDIAHTDYKDLTSAWQAENKAAGQDGVNAFDQAVAQGLNPQVLMEALSEAMAQLNEGKALEASFGTKSTAHQSILAAGELIHNAWLARNGSWAPEEQKPPFIQLDAKNQKLDLNILQTTLETNARAEVRDQNVFRNNLELANKALEEAEAILKELSGKNGSFQNYVQYDWEQIEKVKVFIGDLLSTNSAATQAYYLSNEGGKSLYHLNLIKNSLQDLTVVKEEEFDETRRKATIGDEEGKIKEALALLTNSIEYLNVTRPSEPVQSVQENRTKPSSSVEEAGQHVISYILYLGHTYKNHTFDVTLTPSQILESIRNEDFWNDLKEELDDPIAIQIVGKLRQDETFLNDLQVYLSLYVGSVDAKFSGQNYRDALNLLLTRFGPSLAGIPDHNDTQEKQAEKIANQVTQQAKQLFARSEARVSIDEVLGYLQVGSAQEIKAKTAQYPEMARNYATVTSQELFDSESGKGLTQAEKTAAEEESTGLVDKLTAHFQATGYVVDMNNQALVTAARAQHIGYVSGVLSRSFNIEEQTVREALNQYYNQNGNIEILKASLPLDNEYLKSNGWMFNGGLNDAGNWDFWGFGATDVALNLPGVYAGEAVTRFADILAEGAGTELLNRMLSRTSQEIEGLLQGQGDSKESALASFSARAAQAGWLVSKLGQGIVEAHNPKKEAGSIKRWAPANDLITTFGRMAEKKGWVEVAKDVDQIRAYARHTASAEARDLTPEDKKAILEEIRLYLLFRGGSSTIEFNQSDYGAAYTELITNKKFKEQYSDADVVTILINAAKKGHIFKTRILESRYDDFLSRYKYDAERIVSKITKGRSEVRVTPDQGAHDFWRRVESGNSNLLNSDGENEVVNQVLSGIGEIAELDGKLLMPRPRNSETAAWDSKISNAVESGTAKSLRSVLSAEQQTAAFADLKKRSKNDKLQTWDLVAVGESIALVGWEDSNGAIGKTPHVVMIDTNNTPFNGLSDGWKAKNQDAVKWAQKHESLISNYDTQELTAVLETAISVAFATGTSLVESLSAQGAIGEALLQFASAIHEEWMANNKKEGWNDHLFVPFAELPALEQLKDINGLVGSVRARSETRVTEKAIGEAKAILDVDTVLDAAIKRLAYDHPKDQRNDLGALFLMQDLIIGQVRMIHLEDGNIDTAIENIKQIIADISGVNSATLNQLMKPEAVSKAQEDITTAITELNKAEALLSRAEMRTEQEEERKRNRAAIVEAYQTGKGGTDVVDAYQTGASYTHADVVRAYQTGGTVPGMTRADIVRRYQTGRSEVRMNLANQFNRDGDTSLPNENSPKTAAELYSKLASYRLSGLMDPEKNPLSDENLTSREIFFWTELMLRGDRAVAIGIEEFHRKLPDNEDISQMTGEAMIRWLYSRAAIGHVEGSVVPPTETREAFDRPEIKSASQPAAIEAVVTDEIALRVVDHFQRSESRLTVDQPILVSLATDVSITVQQIGLGEFAQVLESMAMVLSDQKVRYYLNQLADIAKAVIQKYQGDVGIAFEEDSSELEVLKSALAQVIQRGDSRIHLIVPRGELANLKVEGMRTHQVGELVNIRNGWFTFLQNGDGIPTITEQNRLVNHPRLYGVYSKGIENLNDLDSYHQRVVDFSTRTLISLILGVIDPQGSLARTSESDADVRRELNKILFGAEQIDEKTYQAIQQIGQNGLMIDVSILFARLTQEFKARAEIRKAA